jgi:hypothetical protein
LDYASGSASYQAFLKVLDVDMSALKSLLSLGLCLILLCPTLAEPKSNHDARQNGGFVCGTSPERQRDAIARAQYHESRIERLKSLQTSRDLLAPQPYHAVQQDVGDVAVIEDDGTIVVDPNPFDLKSKSFRFEPADFSTYRVVATSTAFDATGGIPISLKDDDSTAITLRSPFSFYGNNYGSVQVNSDGNLTFQQSDTASTGRDIGRFTSGPPRIGPLFTDLNPQQGGTISYPYDPDGLLIVWNNVAEFSDNVPSMFDSFSVKLFQSGNIEFVYGTSVDNQDSVVGISPGGSQGGIAAVDFTPPLPTGALAGSIIEAFASKLQLSESTVAKRFFQSHPDSFDHLNLFLGFSYDLGGNTYAYELNVKNEIQGIGMDVSDDSSYYGSNHRLRSFLNMGTLTGSVNGFSRYPDDPNQLVPGLGTNTTVGVMGHESGHRWEAFTKFRDGATDSTAILGRDLAHWSFFFNSEGSVMEGNEILDRGADQGSTRFQTVGATDTYSHLDLYIMGLLTSESVPPTFLVQNPYGTFMDAASPPAIGVLFGGERKDLTIDSIILANGSRISLAPQARLSEDLPALFPGLSQPPVNGYLSLSSDNGVVGYQSIDTGSTIYSLPAVPASSSSLLYSAQFASGIAGSIRYYSDLNLINTGTQTRNIQVLLVGNDGNPVKNPVTLPPLGAGQQYRTRGETLFVLPDPARADNIVGGSLVITTDGPGVIGDLTFGDPVNFKFIASLPLDGNPASKLVLSQVAEGSVGGEKPYFTGIAMYNPGTSDISVAVDVYSDQGAKTGSATIPLPRGNRISKTLGELVSSIQTQRGRYIRITATGGSIVAFELFGTQTLDFLAAVPPQPISP